MDHSFQNYLIFLCHSIAKISNVTVRLYKKEVLIYHYSIFNLHPDPGEPFISQILNENYRAGVFTTPLFQYYGFLTVKDEWRIIIGPSCIANHDPYLIEEQLFILGIKPQEKINYLHALNSFPTTSAEHVGWFMSFLGTAIDQKIIPIEELYINNKPKEHNINVQKSYAQEQDTFLQINTPNKLDLGFQTEKLLLSYIRRGKPKQVSELLHTKQSVHTGKIYDNTIRQSKNSGICAVTLSSRAAIAGGVDSRTALRIADLYIQKIELLQDIPSLIKLRNDIFIHFAKEVYKVRYRVKLTDDDNASDLFVACAEYVAQNIYNPIRVKDLAQTLGYTRSYLSKRFKQQTGLTLTQYILQEKILESTRMLIFTDKSLLEIANQFSFSSQSHFQNVFKKVIGETPMEYRKRVSRYT